MFSYISADEVSGDRPLLPRHQADLLHLQELRVRRLRRLNRLEEVTNMLNIVRRIIHVLTAGLDKIARTSVALFIMYLTCRARYGAVDDDVNSSHAQNNTFISGGE